MYVFYSPIILSATTSHYLSIHSILCSFVWCNFQLIKFNIKHQCTKPEYFVTYILRTWPPLPTCLTFPLVVSTDVPGRGSGSEAGRLPLPARQPAARGRASVSGGNYRSLPGGQGRLFPRGVLAPGGNSKFCVKLVSCHFLFMVL